MIKTRHDDACGGFTTELSDELAHSLNIELRIFEYLTFVHFITKNLISFQSCSTISDLSKAFSAREERMRLRRKIFRVIITRRCDFLPSMSCSMLTQLLLFSFFHLAVVTLTFVISQRLHSVTSENERTNSKRILNSLFHLHFALLRQALMLVYIQFSYEYEMDKDM